MKLVDNWKKCYKWFSVQAMALSSAALGGWNALPDDMRQTFEGKWVMIGASVLLVLGVFGRLINQETEGDNESK